MSHKIGLWPLALAGLPALASAQELPLKTTTGFEFGAQLSRYEYKETGDDGSFFMSLEGSKLGLVGGYTQAHDNGAYWRLDARYASGNNRYKSFDTGKNPNSPDRYTDARATVGWDFELGSQLLSPYFGLGSRTLKHDGRGRTDTGHWGYRRTSDYFYLPLGLTHRFKLGPQARWSTTLEYDHLIQGTQYSYLTDVPSYTKDLENRQNKGRGLRLNLAYEAAQWSIGMFYQHWNIAPSEKEIFFRRGEAFYGWEPANITHEIGLQFKHHFR